MNDRWKSVARWVVIALGMVFLVRAASGGGCSTLPGKGDPAPAFQAPDVWGKGSWSLQSFRGAPVALIFFATWCPSCKAELPEVARFLARNPDLKVLVVSDEDPRRLADFLQGRGLSIPAAGLAGAVLQDYGVRVLPSVVLVDAEGNVDSSGQGGAATSSALRRLDELSHVAAIKRRERQASGRN